MIEVLNYSFTSGQALDRLAINNELELRLKNPIASDQDRLRRTLVPGIIGNIETNARHSDTFRIYELGRVYLKKDRTNSELAAESSRITGAVYSKTTETPVFYSARQIVVDLLNQCNLKSVRIEPATDALPPYAHAGRSLRVFVDGKEAGLVFELHPAVKSTTDIRGEAVLFDLDMDLILGASRKERKFVEIAKFPDVPFEVSVIAEHNVYAENIAEIITKSNREFIRSVNVFSVYEGAPIPAGKKSVSFRIIFAAKDATLAPAQIESLQKGVIDALSKKGFSIRQ
jgi:phenylalanyl-tRNA synthetase beta chain